MALYHKHNAQMKIYQYCKFQKAVVTEFTFQANKGK
jgi:hypothetical protein